MEEGKSSGTAQSTEESAEIKVPEQTQGGGKSGGNSYSSLSSGVVVLKGSVRNSKSCSSGAQQQLAPVAHQRHRTVMAQQHAALGGQGSSESSHGVGWGSTSVWEHARSIAGSIDGGGGGGGGGGDSQDYSGGRSLDWDVKGSSWEWEHVGSVFPRRRGEVVVQSSTASFASCGGGSAESVSVAPSSHRGSLVTKNEADLHDSNLPPDPSLILRGVDQQQRPTSQGVEGSVLSSEQLQHRRLALGLGETGGPGERRKSNNTQHEFSNGGRVNVGGGDSLIGLKLGRRTYFEDSGGGRGAGPAVFAVCPPGKKHRVQSSGVQVPRCQVEGCKQDLSSSKDYHRRHKVCELHSKAATVIAAGSEQRFCQQCSRFHVLSEFDEGKRSCRRRLAGHNERRRKPPPESAAILSTGSSAVFHNESRSLASSVNGEEGKRGSNGLTEQACYIPMQRTPGSSSTSVDSDDQSGSLGTNFKLNQGKGPWPVVLAKGDDSSGLACQSHVGCGERQSFLSSTTDRERVLMFLQSPKGQIAGSGLQQFTTAGSGSMGPALTLASTAGPASVLAAGLDVPTSPSVSGLSESGRALSLLSSQAWGSSGGASGSVSLPVSTQSDVTLEQLISENSRTPFSPRGSQCHFHASAPANVEKVFRLRHHSPGDLGVSPESREQHRGILAGLGMVGSFESHTMLAVMQEQSEFRGLQGSNSTQRPTIDLMQLPSPPSHGQFAEFSALRPFESTLFDSQQML